MEDYSFDNDMVISQQFSKYEDKIFKELDHCPILR